MAKRIQLTCSVETFRLLHIMIAAYGQTVVKAVAMARMAKLAPEDVIAKAEREMELVAAFMCRVPNYSHFDESPADLFAITVPDDPKDNAEYQTAMREMGQKLALRDAPLNGRPA